MTDHHEIDDFRTALEVLHSYAAESPQLNQRGIVRHLERLLNIVRDLERDRESNLATKYDPILPGTLQPADHEKH